MHVTRIILFRNIRRSYPNRRWTLPKIMPATRVRRSRGCESSSSAGRLFFLHIVQSSLFPPTSIIWKTRCPSWHKYQISKSGSTEEIKRSCHYVINIIAIEKTCFTNFTIKSSRDSQIRLFYC